MSRDRGEKRPGWRLILGPPGTGKTTRTLALVDRALERLQSTEIALVTFTRAASTDARRRAARKFQLSEDDFPWWRTVHSTAFRLLGLKREDVLGPSDAKLFRDLHGYRFSDQNFRGAADGEDIREVVMGDEDDVLFAVYAWARSLRIPAEDATTRFREAVDPRRFETFVQRYEAFKADQEKVDFHDMLEQALESPKRPSAEVAYIDEAQDLSPLQVALVEHWFSECSEVTVAGDDDQAIFGWMGGDPDWLLSLSRSCERVEILRQSYRIPRLVHGMAQHIIGRNQDRVEKQYFPREEMGEIHFADRVEAAMYIGQAKEESVMVLARNWFLLREFSELLAERGVPFLAENHPHWSPLGRPKIMRAVETAMRIGNGKHVSKQGLIAMLSYIPSMIGPKGNKTRVLPHGVKKKVNDHERNSFAAADIKSLGLTPMVKKIQEHGPTSILMRNVDQDLRHAIAQLIHRAGGEMPKPKAILTTVHRAKGREAHTVVILPEMAKATFNAYLEGEMEPERRVAYVAVTRARHRLILCQPEGERYYNYQRPAQLAIDSPPPVAPKPIISVQHAHGLLEMHGREHTKVERKVVSEWYRTVSKPVLYPDLEKVSQRFRELASALEREGMAASDARWAAYLHCRGQSR